MASARLSGHGRPRAELRPAIGRGRPHDILAIVSRDSAGQPGRRHAAQRTGLPDRLLRCARRRGRGLR